MRRSETALLMDSSKRLSPTSTKSKKATKKMGSKMNFESGNIYNIKPVLQEARDLESHTKMILKEEEETICREGI